VTIPVGDDLQINEALRIPAGAAIGKVWTCVDAGTGEGAWDDAPAGGDGGVTTDSTKLGEIRAWTRSEIPADCLLADGASYSQAAYPELYTIAVEEVAESNPLWTVNTTAKTFTVPDLTDSFIYASGSKDLGDTGGVSEVTLTANQSGLRAHSHTYTTPQNYDDLVGGAGSSARIATVGTTSTAGPLNALEAHTNMPPYVVLGFIVQAKPVAAPLLAGPRTVRGIVAPDGSILFGSGFSVTKNSTGNFSVEFDDPFGAPPAVGLNPDSKSGASGAKLYGDGAAPSPSGFHVSVYDSSWAFFDGGFQFTATDTGGTAAEVGGSPEAWHTIGSAGEPAFQNSWTNYGSAPSVSVAAFYRDPLGVVYLKGVVKSGTVGSVPVFTLPVGYRPIERRSYAVLSNGALAIALVQPNGQVQVVSGSNNDVSLDVISFRAEQ
jgi:microcystin-dependent protein